MKIIISALFEEIETIFENYDLKRIKNSKFEIYKTIINEEEILIGCCRIGKANGAMFTQFVLDHFIIDEIIVVGAAGSLNPNLNIGDVVVGKEFIYGDVDVCLFGYKYGQMAQMCEYYPAKKIDLNIFEKNNEFKINYGTIVTVDKFLANYDEKLDLLTRKDAVEMETCAIAQVAYINKVDITSFRVISDNSFYNDNAQEEYEKTKKIVANNLYYILKQYIGGKF